MKTKKVKAVEVIPHIHAIVCRRDPDGSPTSIEVCHARWMDDGRLLFGLDSHQAVCFGPDEEVDVVEEDRPSEWSRVTGYNAHAKQMASRPNLESIRLRKAVQEAMRILKEALDG